MIGILFVGGVVWYNSPEASELAQGLWDSSYDGEHIEGELRDGLGRLVDGETGADNFRLDIGYGKGKGIRLMHISCTLTLSFIRSRKRLGRLEK